MHSEPQAYHTERRSHPRLRAIYNEAREHIDHFFHNRHDWAGSSIDHLAHRVIHEAYPHLHGEEVRILVAAIERMHEALAEEESHRLEAHRLAPDLGGGYAHQ